MNTREWTTAVKLWERAYPNYPGQYSPDVLKLQKWFEQHNDAGFETWTDWPEGSVLRAYLAQFFGKTRPLAPVIELASRRKQA